MHRNREVHCGTKPIGSNFSSPLNSSLVDVLGDDDLAQLIVYHDPSTDSYRLTLRAQRAGVDRIILEIMKRDFVLLIAVYPYPITLRPAAYQRFPRDVKEMISRVALLFRCQRCSLRGRGVRLKLPRCRLVRGIPRSPLSAQLPHHLS